MRPDKGLAQGAGETVALSEKENFHGRPHLYATLGENIKRMGGGR